MVFSVEDRGKVKFDELVATFGADVYRYALWICGNEALAKDLVQETYMRAWKSLDSLKDRRAAKSWLVTIVRREYARTFGRKVPQFVDVDETVVPANGEFGPDEQLQIEQLRAEIMQLPPKYREPLILQVVMGYSCNEIAQHLDITRGAVMTQLFRARERLRERMLKTEGRRKIRAVG